VDKLRGKHVALCGAEDYSDEPQDNPDIRQYLKPGGKVPRGEMLAARYLVHWRERLSEDEI
jgi:hypothetical protein